MPPSVPRAKLPVQRGKFLLKIRILRSGTHRQLPVGKAVCEICHTHACHHALLLVIPAAFSVLYGCHPHFLFENTVKMLHIGISDCHRHVLDSHISVSKQCLCLLETYVDQNIAKGLS